MLVAVIGGGASGMMASIMLANGGHSVVLFEKNNMLGKKLLITGKGRCNITNNSTGAEFLSGVVRGAKFMMGAERKFSSVDTINFFENLGVKTKVERGGRVFPVSDKAKDVRDVMEKRLKNLGVQVRLETEVSGIICDGSAVTGVNVNGNTEPFDAVIVATGGKSYPLTGATGAGYEFAKSVGHKIEEIKPALNGIEIFGSECKMLEGLSLKNVKVSAINSGKKFYESEIGEMLFTSVGVSGPLVLTMSSYINRAQINEISINFKPALTHEQVAQRLDKEIANAPNKELVTLLGGLLPRRLLPIFAERIGLNLNTKLNQITRQKRENLTNLLVDFRLKFKRVEPVETSVITSGGVALNEINPTDMSSKLMGGLFFIGEVLDIDAVTGGYNLQIAFSTANACAGSKFFKGVQ